MLGFIMSKVTMKDIADKLHVSINAVSLALNDKEGISHQLRILKQSKLVNYRKIKFQNDT